MHGHGGLPQARPHRSQPAITHRLPVASLHAANGAANTLFSLVRESKPVRFPSITHICTRSPVTLAAPPFVTRNSLGPPSLPGVMPAAGVREHPQRLALLPLRPLRHVDAEASGGVGRLVGSEPERSPGFGGRIAVLNERVVEPEAQLGVVLRRACVVAVALRLDELL